MSSSNPQSVEPTLHTPRAVASIAEALGCDVCVTDESADILGWEAVPASPYLQALRAEKRSGPTIGYLAPRRGRWRAVLWPMAPMGLAGPTSPCPQPIVLAGVIEDATKLWWARSPGPFDPGWP